MQSTTKLPGRLMLYTTASITLFIIGYAIVPLACEIYSCVATMLENYLLEIVLESEKVYAIQS